jgi:hypothetical protein
MQSDSKTFYVEIVDVSAKYNATYILRYSHAIVPPDKLVTERDVSCLVSELKASGLFTDVQAKLMQKSRNTSKLLLTTTNQYQIKRFVISEITLDELPEVDNAKFQTKLNEKGIKPGTPLLKFYYETLEEKINEALREALPPNLVKDNMGSAWITIRPAGKRKVRLIVSPSYTRCQVTDATNF